MPDRNADAAVQVRQLFDAKAATWPSKYAPEGRLADRLTRLASAVTYHVSPGATVLDLGCGTGELAGAIAAAGMRATGCDISPEMLHRAASADPSGTVDWVQLHPGWQVLPFASEAFGTVVPSSVLEYIDDPSAVLHECRRVLRPGGIVFCTVPDPCHPVRWLEWLIDAMAREPVVQVAGRRWPRLDAYLAYLQVSQHRHSSRWWRTAAARAGLLNLLRGSEWAALFLYLSAVALTGERAGLIAPTVYFVWVYSTQVRVITLKWIVAGVLQALICGTLIAHYRHYDGLSPGSPRVVIQDAVGAVSSSAWFTEETVIYVPSTARYMHGSTYLAAVESQLPGPVARAMGAPTRTASAVFRNIIGFSDPNQGFAESYPSEADLNFGLVGCLGAGLFLGALTRWAWRKHRMTATRPRDLLYPVLLAGLVYGFRSDALTQIKDVLYPMLAVWVLMGWYRVRYRRRPASRSDSDPSDALEAITGTLSNSYEGLMRTGT